MNHSRKRYAIVLVMVVVAASFVGARMLGGADPGTPAFRAHLPRMDFDQGSARFPDRVQLSGRIVEASVPPGCGVLAWAGTVRVRIAAAEPRFPRSEIVVVVPCLSDPDRRLLGREVELAAIRLTPSAPQECHYHLASAPRTGAPLYCSPGSGFDALTRSAE